MKIKLPKGIRFYTCEHIVKYMNDEIKLNGNISILIRNSYQLHCFMGLLHEVYTINSAFYMSNYNDFYSMFEKVYRRAFEETTKKIILINLDAALTKGSYRYLSFSVYNYIGSYCSAYSTNIDFSDILNKSYMLSPTLSNLNPQYQYTNASVSGDIMVNIDILMKELEKLKEQSKEIESV